MDSLPMAFTYKGSLTIWTRHVGVVVRWYGDVCGGSILGDHAVSYTPIKLACLTAPNNLEDPQQRSDYTRAPKPPHLSRLEKLPLLKAQKLLTL